LGGVTHGGDHFPLDDHLDGKVAVLVSRLFSVFSLLLFSLPVRLFYFGADSASASLIASGPLFFHVRDLL
jgi:hypothetical protein